MDERDTRTRRPLNAASHSHSYTNASSCRIANPKRRKTVSESVHIRSVHTDYAPIHSYTNPNPRVEPTEC